MNRAERPDPPRSYEPPLSEEGSSLVPGEEDLIAPGVRGYAIKSGERIFIPLIIAEKEGAGDVGRFLDSLSPRCVIPNVTSPRLRGMLQRRGWKKHWNGEVDIWEQGKQEDRKGDRP